MTLSMSSSFDEGAAAPVCSKEEDALAAGSVVAVVPPPPAVASTAEVVSRTGAPSSCIAEPWGGAPSLEVPWAPDPWGEGVTFRFDTLESRNKGQ
jgi:hypothetical protein